MVTDIVMPQNNEKELAAMAQTLGVDTLLLLYPFGKAPVELKIDIPHDIGVICVPQDLDKARQRHKIVAVMSSEHDRIVFERMNAPNFIIGLGESIADDRTHQRQSGLNQPLLKDLHRRESKVVISIAALLKREGQPRAQLIGRWMQNIAICRKSDVPIVIASLASYPYEMRSPHDMEAIGVMLGMHPKEAHDATH